jgi:hypothetical protein
MEYVYALGQLAADAINNYPVQSVCTLGLLVAATYAFAGVSLALTVIRGGAR